MPQATSTSLQGSSTPVVVRLVDTAGRDGPATASEVVGHLQTGGFFWLDLEDPGDDELCARGHRWARMIREVKSAIVNARAGNQATAAGAEGGAAADILVLGSDAQAAGYYGRFPG